MIEKFRALIEIVQANILALLFVSSVLPFGLILWVEFVSVFLKAVWGAK